MSTIEWEKNKITPKHELVSHFVQFSKTPGPKKELFPIVNAFEIFTYFWNPEICQYIAMQSEAYFKEHFFEEGKFYERYTLQEEFRKNKGISKDDVLKYLIIRIFMGLVKFPDESDYWSEHTFFHSIFSSALMSRLKYRLLASALHLEEDLNEEDKTVSNSQAVPEENKEDEKEETNTLKKIKQFINSFNELAHKAYIPNKDLSIDESMVKLKL